MMNWGVLLEKWFRRQISAQRIEKYINSLKIQVSSETSAASREDSTVSCVQRQIRPVRNLEEYIDMLHSFVRQAAEEKSQLIVFPEYNFFDLFGLIPGFGLINSYLTRKTSQKQKNGNESESGDDGSFLTTIFSSTADSIEVAVEKTISLLARSYGIYIYSGSYIKKENGILYNAGSLYGSDGNRIGTQKKLHLTDFEAALGMGRDTELKVLSLPFGKVAFPICMDATYFETFRIARELGADIVILPIANMEEYHLWRSLRGIWTRVQESYVFGLKASLNGWVAGMHFTGKAGIFAPLSITPGEDGVIAVSPHYEGDSLVTSPISIKKLYDARERDEYHGDRNFEFERNYIEKTYKLY